MKAKNKPSKLSAFTLFETLLVLSCCLLFLLIPTISIQYWQRKIEANQFLASFEKNILFTQQIAILNGKNTQLSLDEQNQKILFYSIQQEEPSKILMVPKTLKVSGPKKIIFKQFTGNNGNLSKFVFYLQFEKKRIEYQFQLGSGRFVKKIIEL